MVCPPTTGWQYCWGAYGRAWLCPNGWASWRAGWVLGWGVWTGVVLACKQRLSRRFCWIAGVYARAAAVAAVVAAAAADWDAWVIAVVGGCCGPAGKLACTAVADGGPFAVAAAPAVLVAAAPAADGWWLSFRFISWARRGSCHAGWC